MANDMGTDDVREAASRGKREKADRIFLDSNGKEFPRTFEGVQAVEFRFKNGHKLHMPLDSLPEGILRAAAAFGINTSVGNTFGAIEDLEDALEAAESRWEQLCRGVWSAERSTGPRTGDLLEALCRALAGIGKRVTEADREGLEKQLEDAAFAKSVGSDPQVAVHLAAIRKERAEERARKALEADTGKPSILAGLL